MSDSLPTSALRGAVDLSSLRNRPSAGAPQSSDAAAPQRQAGSGPVVASLVFDATDASFGEVVELSRQVPVVVDLWAEWCGPCKQLSPVIERVVADYAGRVLLAKVDVDQNPQLAQAFQAQSIPMVVAIVGGQPVPLFNGAVPEQQVRQVFEQLLQLATQNGVSATASLSADVDQPQGDEPPVEPLLPPLHQQAFDAIERGDYDAAIAAYEQAVREQPGDADAKTGISQVRLLQRVQSANLQDARAAAADNPGDIDAQLLVADLDVTGGHVDDAFDRLLSLFAGTVGDDRERVKQHLIELFGVIGATDQRVGVARSRLASLLF